jgi:tripartite-type tricarboxylate transporter receptor subunit TctC
MRLAQGEDIMNVQKNILGLVLAGAVSAALTGASMAQDQSKYPVDTVTLVTDSSPGGGTDIYFREMIKYLEPLMGVNFVVQNITAGGGAAAMSKVAQGKPDGSIFYGVTPSYVYMSLLSEVEHTYKDLQPLVNVFDDPVVVFTKTDSPYKDLASLIAAAKDKPQKWAAGSPTSLSRIALEELKRSTGAQATVVPHDGGAEALINVLNGSLDMGIGEIGEITAQVQAGKLRVLAALRENPMEQYPEIPTAKSQGVPMVVVQFRGLTGPKGLPDDVVKAWETAIPKVLENPEFKKWYQNVSFVPSFLPSAEFAKFIDNFAEAQRKTLVEVNILKQ